MATEVTNIPVEYTTVDTIVPTEEVPAYKYMYDYGALSWPSIIIIIIGIVLVIYAAVDPSIDNNRRVLGIILIVLWTALWALLLWVLWRNGRRVTAWWLLLIPSISIIVFFVLVLTMNLGA